jgi:epoxide hydrolase-like predicted phosphatase
LPQISQGLLGKIFYFGEKWLIIEYIIMIKAIFFDWGHTFTSTGFIDAKEQVDELLKSYNSSWDEFYPYWKNLYILRSQGAIKSNTEMGRQLKIMLKKDIPFDKITDLIIDSHIIPQENIEVIKELKKNYKVGLLTNNIKEFIDRVLKNYKIEDLFDAVIVSSEIGARKPDARIFFIALKKLSIKPEESIFVSDELSEDLIGAKGCGMKTVWLDSGVENEWIKKEWIESEREIGKLFPPDATIKNLQEVPSLIEKI